MVAFIDELHPPYSNILLKRKEDSTSSSSESSAVRTPSSSSSSPSASQTSTVDELLDSNGCVVCDTTPSCPQCESNQQCAMTTQTCAQCPTTYCIDISDDSSTASSSSSLSSAEVGGIAGALSGFFFILLLVGAYFLYKKYKKHLFVDYELGIGEEMKELTGFNDDDDFDEGNLGYGNGVRGNIHNARSSQFLHPSNAEKRMSQTSLSTMTNSVFTKASNVLNIVYIPGVTNSRPARPIVGGSRRNTRRPVNSAYSRGMSVYSKETYFSDLENASFHGGNVATRGGNPMLVEINQDDYNYDDEDKDLNKGDEDDHYPININLQLPPLPERRQMDDDIVEEEENESEEEEKDISAGQGNSYGKGYESDLDEDEEGRRKSHLIEEDEEEGQANGDEYEDDAIQLDIGMSSNNNRTVPTRYAALIEKKDQTNHAQVDPFFSNKDAMGKAVVSDPHNESYSESSSDSDEENIEMLLHQNGQSSGNNTNSYTLKQNNSSNSNSINPFLSPLD